MTAGRRAIALMAVGIMAAGIWQVRATAPRPAGVAFPVMNEETENARVRPPVVRAASGGVSPARLERFGGCAPMLRYLRRKALPMVTEYGFVESGMFFGGRAIGAPMMRGPAPAIGGGMPAPGVPAPSPNSPRVLGMTTTPDYSTTNVQEEGVDEPDIVKTDGRFIYSVALGRLRAVEIVDGTPKLRGSLAVSGTGHEILVAGKRALVIAVEASPGSALKWKVQPHTSVAIVDLTNPGAMKVLDRLHIEGSYVSARMARGLVRLVTRSQPSISFTSPTWANGKDDSPKTLKANRAAVKRAGTRSWLPEYALDRGRRTVEHGLAVPCSQAYKPSIFAGLGMVTVLTIDPANPQPREGTTIAADAETVYATTGSLYVAAHRWIDPAQDVAPQSSSQTQIHKFDISARGEARYLASGLVRGHLLNQWSLSEHRGVLRVATTEDAIVSRPSESFVNVFEQQGRILTSIGRVGGLGKTERIYGVRFMGDTGYVVTFRKTDPLYVVDLSNPRRPRVRGELKILGYSSYLHPIGEGLLLGVGQDATAEGLGQGAQVSLFDVSNPKNPRRIAQLKLGERGTDIDIDHRAFLWWPAKRLAVVSVRDWWAGGAEGFRGGVGLRVTEKSVREVGRIQHGPAKRLLPIDRSLVIGNHVYTVSQLGLMASSIDSLAKRAWIEW